MSGPAPARPSWRKPFGALLILLLIAVWTLIVVQLARPVGRLPGILQALFYLVAGLGWIWLLPLRRLLAWMEGGPR